MKNIDGKEIGGRAANDVDRIEEEMAMARARTAEREALKSMAADSREDSSALAGFQKGMDMANKRATEKVYSEKEVAELIAKEVKEYNNTIDAIVDEIVFLRELCLKMVGK